MSDVSDDFHEPCSSPSNSYWATRPIMNVMSNIGQRVLCIERKENWSENKIFDNNTYKLNEWIGFGSLENSKFQVPVVIYN